MMDENTARIMWAVFQWAYKNKIEVTLTPRSEYGSTWSELTFQRDGKFIRSALYSLTDTGSQMEYAWRNIALKLCVEPLELPGGERE
jgi:hypothetical protein